MYDEKWILYNNWQWPSQWLDQEESLKYFPKANLHPKMVMVTVLRSAASLIHSSFLNPGETITSEKYAQQISEMHQQRQCLQLAFSNRMGPIVIHDQHPTARHTANTSKVVQSGLQSFASSTIFTWSLTNQLPVLQGSWQLFAGRMLSQPTEGRKCFVRVRRIWSTDFYAMGINKLVSRWQKCVDCNGSYFD